MSTTTTTINVRIDKKTKSLAQDIIEDIGLDISSAIKAFFRKIIQTGSIPFLLEQNGRLNNPIYIARLKKEIAQIKKHGQRFDSAQELIDDIIAQ